MATEYATLVFKADTKEIGQAYNQLKKLNAEGKISDSTFKALTVQTDRLGKSAQGATKSFGLMRGGAQNLSYQLQDVAVQAQMGTDAARILAQQGPQIASAFGAGGAALGALIAFGALLAGPLINSLLGSSEALAKFQDIADEIDVSLRTDAPALYAARMKELETAEDSARESIQKTEQQLVASQQFLQKVIDQEREGIISKRGLELATIKQNEEEAKLLVVLDQQLIKLREAEYATNQFATAKTSAEKAQDAQTQSVLEFVKELTIQNEMLNKSEAEQAAYRVALIGGNSAVQAIVKSLQEQIDANKELQKQENEAKAFIKRVEQQARATGNSKSEALQLEMATKALTIVERERLQVLINTIAAEEQKVIKQRESQKAIRELESAGLLNAERDEYDSYARRQKMIEDFYARDLISKQQAEEAKANLEKDMQKQSIQTFGEGLTALGQYNEKAFKAAKAFNIAQAIMNTYTGATKALATYPPPFNFIAAAGVVASGLAQVASIKSQTYQGRALGGQVREGESYVVGERGPEVLTMGGSGRIIPNDKLGGQGQTVNKIANVSFNISTVDASGFDQLLQSRRGQIIGMINTAMNDQGRKALV